jgi:hypothetical protein
LVHHHLAIRQRASFAVASNREEVAAGVIWKHNRHGSSENWHKELKRQAGIEEIPRGQREANAPYFAIDVPAYNLAQLLKRRALPESYPAVTLATLPWKAFRLGVKLVRHARGLILQIKADTGIWLLLQVARVQCAWLRA